MATRLTDEQIKAALDGCNTDDLDIDHLLWLKRQATDDSLKRRIADLCSAAHRREEFYAGIE